MLLSLLSPTFCLVRRFEIPPVCARHQTAHASTSAEFSSLMTELLGWHEKSEGVRGSQNLDGPSAFDVVDFQSSKPYHLLLARANLVSHREV